MIKSERRQIGEFTYELTQFGAREGREILALLVRVLGPGLAELGADQSPAVAMGRVAAGITGQDFATLTDAVARKTKLILTAQFNGSQGTTALEPFDLAPRFDEHFAGRYGEMIELVLFAIELNNFPGALAAVGARRTSETAK